MRDHFAIEPRTWSAICMAKPPTRKRRISQVIWPLVMRAGLNLRSSNKCTRRSSNGGPKLLAPFRFRSHRRLTPLWLRGATAIASVLFCILAVLAVARFWQRTPVVNNTGEPKFTRAQLDDAVASAVKKAGTKQVDNSDHSDKRVTGVIANSKPPRRERKQNSTSPELASRRTRLTRQEREQLAADLRLIPGSDEDEVPFELPGDTRFPNEPK